MQKRVLNLFSQSSLKDKFYWTGGTALAHLYLHHRRSHDLDFFSDNSFTYNQIIGFVRQLKKELNLPFIEEKKIYDRREFLLHNRERLRLEFVYYPHPGLKARRKINHIFVDSLDDIAANKLMAHFDRNDPKDLFDLYFLLAKSGYSSKKLIKLTEKKFGVKFDQGAIFSEAYKSLKDLKELKPLILDKDAKTKQKIIEEIQRYFFQESERYLLRKLR